MLAAAIVATAPMPNDPAEILRGGTVWSGYLRLDAVG
jgi:hypothetical protein